MDARSTHNGLAMLMPRISRLISNDTAVSTAALLDFQRQYDLKPTANGPRCPVGQLLMHAFGNSRRTRLNISLSVELERPLVARPYENCVTPKGTNS
jgi:hypothetical protein